VGNGFIGLQPHLESRRVVVTSPTLSNCSGRLHAAAAGRFAWFGAWNAVLAIWDYRWRGDPMPARRRSGAGPMDDPEDSRAESDRATSSAPPGTCSTCSPMARQTGNRN